MSTCVISFSSREAGNCASLGRFIVSQLPDAEMFDFSTFSIHPCGSCRYECFTDRNMCPYIGDMECRLLEAVVRSTRAYFVLPNYCDYPCANYFAFNERSQCFFQGRPDLLEAYGRVPKRMVVVSNTNEENFRRVLAYQSEPEPEILFLAAKKYGKLSIRGDLLTDERVLTDLRDFIWKP